MTHDGLIAGDLLRGPEVPTALLRDLPKVDLHVHLDGSLRFETYVELANAAGQTLAGGSEEGARRLFAGDEAGQTLEDYIDLFDHPLGVLQSADALKRAARELVRDCNAENVRWVEIRFTPSLHLEGGLSLEEATDAVLAGMHQGEEGGQCRGGLLIAGVRHRGTEEVQRLAELTVAYKNRGVVGFDLAGAEADNPAKRHLGAFYLILNNNINCTVHAGEAWGPESIHQAIHYLNAHRIGHGTRLEEAPELMRYVADNRIPVEVGWTSSVRTRSLPAGTIHPLRRFLQHGLRVTLCTNNRLFLSPTLTDELRAVIDEFDLTLLEVENLVIAGFKSAFLPQARRVALLRTAVDDIRTVRIAHGLEAEA